MSNKYTKVIEKVGDYTDTFVDYEFMGYTAYELPNNVVLMVHKDAPEDIKESALKAQEGNHGEYLNAIRDTTTWLYKIESSKDVPVKSTKLNELQQVCDKNGKEGWELVNATYNVDLNEYTLFFKKYVD